MKNYNSLSNTERFALQKWVDQNQQFCLEHTDGRTAAHLSDLLGFTITGNNVQGARESVRLRKNKTTGIAPKQPARHSGETLFSSVSHEKFTWLLPHRGISSGLIECGVTLSLGNGKHKNELRLSISKEVADAALFSEGTRVGVRLSTSSATCRIEARPDGYKLGKKPGSERLTVRAAFDPKRTSLISGRCRDIVSGPGGISFLLPEAAK